MRRTARLLSVVALAGVVAGATPALAADPAAEVTPSTAQAGGNVTVSVSCEAIGGSAPDTMDASSQAFDDGTVQLRRTPGTDDRAAGAAYRGTARISTDEQVGRDSAWTVDGTCPAAPGGQGRPWSATFSVAHGGGGQQPCQETRGDSCAGTAAAVERGVRAGEGGTFTDSVPALVAGGVLIAAACGGAVYRLRRRTPGH
ncbi:hypothetical protein ABZT04_45650 [Streptomyces sp. NPDC005492]|uniref:hypothetical protein n=1 Tax=Streptomyces sp. NPDC005492 TaxID=3156883 RepID=UPI0033A88DAD